jgi:hypothetical protein
MSVHYPTAGRKKFNFAGHGYCEPGKEQNSIEPEWWFEGDDSAKSIDSRLAQEATHLSSRQCEEYARLFHDMVVYEPKERLSAVNVVLRLRSIALLEGDLRK